jgi:hypothetical protein
MDARKPSHGFTFRSSADDLARWRSRSGPSIRPLAPQERNALAALVRREAGSRRFGEFTGLGDIVLALAWPVELNAEPSAAFAAIDDSGTVSAIGCYHQVAPGVSELSFLVDEAVQDGMAARLVRRLADDARSRGVSRFDVQVPLENRRAFEALRQSGYPMTCEPHGGTASVTLSLSGRRADSA